MRRKNYYHILGVSRSESAEAIKAAFRRLAKIHHPDLAGQCGTRAFQELAEAYHVLSDPESRRKYTNELDRIEGRPAAPEFYYTSPGTQDIEQDFPYDIYGPFDEMFRRLLRSFGFFGTIEDWLDPAAFRRGASPKKRYTAELELILTSEEAKKGGVLPAEITLSSPCATCLGAGEMLTFQCPSCSGWGITTKPASIQIEVPPGTKNRAILRGRISRPDADYIVRIQVKVRRVRKPNPPRSRQERTH